MITRRMLMGSVAAVAAVPLNRSVPAVSVEAAYDHMIRNFNNARRIELENLPGNIDLSTLDPYERRLVEAFRQTDQWKHGARLYQGAPAHFPA